MLSMLLLAVALACVENALTGARVAAPLEATTITVLSPVYNETRTVAARSYLTVWNGTRTTTSTVATAVVVSRVYSTLTVFIVKEGVTTLPAYTFVYETETTSVALIVSVVTTPASVVTTSIYSTQLVPLYVDTQTRVIQFDSSRRVPSHEEAQMSLAFLIILALCGLVGAGLAYILLRTQNSRELSASRIQ